MSFTKPPVVNVKTSDTTGYIIEFLTQSTMGPGGCVRVTTRDVLKLSALSHTMGEIMPQVGAPVANQFTITPEVVVRPSVPGNGYGGTPIIVKKTSFNESQCRHSISSQQLGSACNVQTGCVSMEDVACITDNPCRVNTCSQTEFAQSTDQSTGNCSDLEYYEDEKEQRVVSLDKCKKQCPSCSNRVHNNEKKTSTRCKSKNRSSRCGKKTQTDAKPSSSRESIKSNEGKYRKKCTCQETSRKSSKSRSSVEKEKCSKESQTSMETNSQENVGKKSDDGSGCNTQQSHPKRLCKTCSAKLSSDSGSQSSTSTNEDEQGKQCNEHKRNKSGDRKSFLFSDYCKKCHSGHNCRVEVEQKIYDIYKNDDFDENGMNDEPMARNAKENMSCQCNLYTNSVSLMNIDLTTNNYKNRESSSSMSDSDGSKGGKSDKSTSTLCSSCRSKESMKSKGRCKQKPSSNDRCTSTDPEIVEPKAKCRAKEKEKKHKCSGTNDLHRSSKSDKPCCLACQYAKRRSKESDTSVKDCGTSMDTSSATCSDSMQTSVIRLTDECVQCITTKCANACVFTPDEHMDTCGPGEPAPVSFSQSIKDFMVRYIWGDPITRNTSTQAGTTGQKCFAWNSSGQQTSTVMRSECTNTPPVTKCQTKDSSTQMDLDDRPSQCDQKPDGDDDPDADNIKNHLRDQKHHHSLLKKPTEKADSDSDSSSSLSSKRSVLFKPEAAIFNEEGLEDEYVAIRPDKSGKPTERDIVKVQDVDQEAEENNEGYFGFQYDPTSNVDEQDTQNSEADDDNDKPVLKTGSTTSLVSVYILDTDDSFASIANGESKEGVIVSDPNSKTSSSTENSAEHQEHNDESNKNNKQPAKLSKEPKKS